MKSLSTNPRVLLCTVYRRFRGDYMDIAGRAVYSHPRAGMALRVSPGLRFIKQNVPEVEILEYPLWHEYVEKLKQGWDVVGFSFFQIHIGEIRKMIEEARRHGVREIWAGGYGALDNDIPGLVDRVFIGPGEDRIAQVFGHRVKDEDIQHPVMMVHVCFVLGLRHVTLGLLYTTHGCPFRCTFCQTQAFESRHFVINFESIKRVVAYYHKIGINDIAVMDELFGTHPKFADKLTRLLAHYKMRWWVQSRAALYRRYLDVWYERGLRMPAIGVESMTQSSLDSVKKRHKIEEVIEYARRSREKPGMFRFGNCIIGYEHMTAEELIDDVIRFKQLGFDAHNLSVLTPYPRTPLRDEIVSKYGIFDHAYRHYGGMHLVWNHPHISSVQMRYLLKYFKGFLNRPVDLYRKGIKRLILDELRQQGSGFLWRHLIKGLISSMRIDDRALVYF
ncbi:radical SAM protein [candidate division TA06 bacterium B3_TA06]|uniref:Radical SAM protein n=1 Tax=candidate division TA06 bacterium B3_TA06 TaxID=2012487 RepID=A0A532V705_UNCT6|nr:MAG: radical SAM protein [candidate division TA06 bacterium B3_TA06]